MGLILYKDDCVSSLRLSDAISSLRQALNYCQHVKLEVISKDHNNMLANALAVFAHHIPALSLYYKGLDLPRCLFEVAEE